MAALQYHSSSPGRVWRAGLTAAAVSTAADVVIYAAARAVGVAFLVPMGQDGPTPLPLGMVVAASVLGPLLGAGVLALLARFERDGSFRTVGLVALLLSFGAPLTSGADAATTAALLAMHVAAGLASIAFLGSAVGRQGVAG